MRSAIGWFLLVVVTTPLAGGAETVRLSLQEAQNEALRGNKMLAVARAGVEQAEAMRLTTWAGRLPSVSLSETAVRTNNALSAFGMRLRQERVTQMDFAPDLLNDPDAIAGYQTVVELRQPLFNGGQALYGRRQATAGLRAAEAQLSRGEHEVRLHTAQAYWGVVLAQESLAAVRQALESATAHEATARALFEQDIAPLSDLLAAQVRVAELRGQEIDAANQVAAARDNLSLVLGLSDRTEVAPVDTLAFRDLAGRVDELVEKAMAARPDLDAAGQQVEAARHGIGVARSGYLPHLNAFAQADLDADAPFSRQGESWTVGAMVTWNVFSGLSTVGEVRAAKAQLGQARYQREFLHEQARREVAQAWRTVRAAQEQVRIAAEAVAQAAERLRMTELQYRETLVTATDLLDAETALTHARLRRLQALHGLNVGMAQLEFAVGGTL